MHITYIAGGVFLLIGIIIFVYNWRHPTDDIIMAMSENAKRSKLIWGFWHTGEHARRVFRLGTIRKVLVLNPDPQSATLLNILHQTSDAKNDLIENIRLTTESAIANAIPVRWHDDPTVLGFTICDPSPIIDENTVVFSKRAYVIVQVADSNLISDDWKTYKKTKAKDSYAFDAYVKWFNRVWDSSPNGKAREG